MVSMVLTAEQRQIQESFRAFLDAEAPIGRLRSSPCHDGKIVRAMAELGWMAIGLPEEAGGLGLGAIEEVLLFRELGRHLVSPSFLAAYLSAQIAQICGAQDLFAELVEGTRSASLALAGDGDDRILGLDLGEADYVLVVRPSTLALYARSSLAGTEDAQCLDDSLSLHRIALPDSPTCELADKAESLVDRATLLLAAQSCGLADGARELAVDYAKMREAYGRPIGSFQAIKHICADMAMRADSSWAATMFAATIADLRHPGAHMHIAAAHLSSAAAALANGASVIQVHGGIGFSAEADAHRFVKRAHVYDLCAGGGTALRKKVLDGPLFW